jgi:predicted DNA-binding transcriptional regulator YafY
MKDRFFLFRRSGVFYIQDRQTGQQKSLHTRDKAAARRMLQAKNDSVSQPTMNLLMARTYLAAQDPRLITRTWADVIRVSGPEVADEEDFEIVLRAVQQHRPLQFRYRKHAARTVEGRRIHPYELVCVANRWYVIGEDQARKAMRCFVLSRLRSPEILPGTFKRPADFDIQKYLSGSFGIFKGKDDFEVVLELDAWAADVLRGRRWHPSQQIVELADGAMRVTFLLDNLEEIEPWVLSWGGHATVIRPKRLQDRVAAAAAAVVARYADPAPPRSLPDAQRELRLRHE